MDYVPTLTDIMPAYSYTPFQKSTNAAYTNNSYTILFIDT